MAMRIQVREHGGPEVLEWVPVDVGDPAPDEVQIEQKAIGLNFLDTYFRSGLYPCELPHGLGSEGSGVVTAVGSEVTHLKVGDRVAYGQAPLGAYATVRNLPARDAVKLPDGISFETAAAMMLKGLTVFYLFFKTYPLQTGQTIVFHAAAGGVGHIACQWAKALGVRLIGTASTQEKMDQALKNGAWKMINYTTENVPQKVLEFTQGQKVPVVYDSVGASTFMDSLDCLQTRGLMVSFGNASGPVTGVNLGILAQKGSLYVTRPMLGYYVNTQETMQEASNALFTAVLKGDITIHIGQRFALKDAAQAHRALESRATQGSTVLLVD